MRKQFSQACENNKSPILEVLREAFEDVGRVLEVGSGTGQHAVHFAKHLPHLTWVPSDVPGNLGSIRAWREDADLPNLAEPLELDLFEDDWSVGGFDAFYTANVIHVTPWEATERIFAHADAVLEPSGLLFFYGPFEYEDRELEPSNVGFNRWLKEQDPEYGIRLFEDLAALADEHDFLLEDDRAMPANNRSIWWRKV
jgi:SAM-dependent methyltransferase